MKTHAEGKPISTRSTFIARLAILMALTMIIQTAGLPQPFTGPLVNALLFLAASILGGIGGIVLGCTTPVIALLTGQLPAVLAPMLPLIAIGNMILVVIYDVMMRNIRFSFKIYPAILLAAIGKYLFLFFSVKLILPMILARQLPEKFIMLMTTPQLITALAGGAIAIFALKILKKVGVTFLK